VNALLFLSLVISITCALLATLLHQWARRYVSFTQQSGYSLHKRARIRAFFSDGVDKFRVSWVAEALPALLHLSLCFFLAGLLVWLYNINVYLFFAVVWWVGLSALAYVWITFLPIFRHNSPYYAPLSSTLWFLYTGIPYAVFKVLSSSALSTRRHFDNLKYYYERLSDGIGKTAQKTAWEMASETDVRILVSTLEALGKDGARAKFFEAIPGFFESNQVQVKDLEEDLHDFQTKFGRELGGFLGRTFSTSSIPESVKSDQLITCLNATHAVLDSDGVSQILLGILNGERWPELSQSVEMAHSLRRWSKSTDDKFAPFVRRIVTQVIADARERDERWISLTEAEIGVPDHVLRDNIRHGDNTLLSLLIHATRQAFSSGSWTPFTLSSLTRFDIRNARPELQHEFCDLWNEIVREALRGRLDSIDILREIRHAFLGLHQGADVVHTAFSSRTHHFHPVLADPLSYRVCNISSHRPDWTQAPREPVTTHLTVTVTPTRAAFRSSTASTTQIGDSPCPSPRPIPMGIQRNPGKAEIVIISPDSHIIQTAPQQADDTNVVLRFPSSTSLAITQPDYTPHHTHALWSTAPSPVYTTPRVHLLPSKRLFDQASQFALSVDDADANHVRPGDTMTDPYGSEVEENSQVSVGASLPDLRPDPISTIVGPSTCPIPPPSFSVPDQNHVLDASQCLTLAATSRHPPESNQRQDTAVPCAASDTGEISSTASPISLSIPSSGATLQRGAKVTAIPTTVVSVSGSQSSAILVPAELPSSEKSTYSQPHSQPISHPLGSSSSSSSTTRSHISPQSPVINFTVTPTNGNSLAHGDTSEVERPIPMKVLVDSSQSVPPTLDIITSTSPPDGHQNGPNTDGQHP